MILCFNVVCLVAVGTARCLTLEDRVALCRAGCRYCSSCVKVIMAALFTACARGRSHIRGNLFAEEKESKLGIVNEDVTCTRDGFYRVVTAKLPGINRVSFHPLEHNVETFHYAALAPSVVTVAPTNVNVKEYTRNVTAKVVLIVRFVVRIIVSGALSVSGVTARAVFTRRGRAKHHKVIFIASAEALTVRPGVLAVPTAVPRRTDLISRIEGRDLSATTLTVCILEKTLCCVIARNVAVRALHHILQFLEQRAVRRVRRTRSARVS